MGSKPIHDGNGSGKAVGIMELSDGFHTVA